MRLDLIKNSYSFIFNKLRKNNIIVNLHYLPVHLHPYYQKLGFKHGDFPESEKYSKEALTIPLFANLSKSQQDFVIKKIIKYCV